MDPSVVPKPIDVAGNSDATAPLPDPPVSARDAVSAEVPVPVAMSVGFAVSCSCSHDGAVTPSLFEAQPAAPGPPLQPHQFPAASMLSAGSTSALLMPALNRFCRATRWPSRIPALALMAYVQAPRIVFPATVTFWLAPAPNASETRMADAPPAESRSLPEISTPSFPLAR
jgi:hypothetical protein